MAAGELFASRDCGLWRDSLDRYEEAVRLVTSQKKRREGESLILLDKWSEKESHCEMTYGYIMVGIRGSYRQASPHATSPTSRTQSSAS